MDAQELIGVLLGVHNYSPDQIAAALDVATLEVKTYTAREMLDDELQAVAVQIAVIKLNRLGTEGAQSLNYSGVSENYINGYPAHVVQLLNCKRLVRLL